jgi:hypothetical protein
MGYVELLKAARAIVHNYVCRKKFIDHTPLENDVPVMMALFAQDQIFTLTAENAELLKDLNDRNVKLREMVKEEKRLNEVIVELRRKLECARKALRSLCNEASGFYSQADRENHGNTNMACMENRINAAKTALKEIE